MERWLSRRIPDNRQFKMDMSNIFIFPSKFGIWFLLLSFTLFILGSNYRNNLMLLLSFFLVSLFLVTLMSSFANFARLKVQLGRINPVFAGEQILVPLWLSNNANSADSNELPEGKLHFRFWQQAIQTSIDPASHNNPVTMLLEPKVRGLHDIPRVTIEAYYPLGLYRCWTHLRFSAKAVVYPKPIPCDIRTLTSDSEGQDGSSSKSMTGIDDFDSLKNYVQGEPLHRIAWKQVAKGRGMVSKQFSGESPDIHWISPALFEQDKTETVLGKLCHLVLTLSSQQQYFGLTIGGMRIEPGTGEHHKEQCLYALATFELETNDHG
ncbi:MAG: DUF58 domain-containing protein [Aestuariibacter sp.]